MACRETLAAVAELISKSRVPTPSIQIFKDTTERLEIFSKPCGYQFTKLGHALELHKLGGVYIQRLWVYRLPLALAWWARGSTAIKRSLFKRGVGLNKQLSIQIFDLNRRDRAPVPDSGKIFENFHENSLPSRDPRGANSPQFCFEGCNTSVRRVKLTHARAATRKKSFQIF